MLDLLSLIWEICFVTMTDFFVGSSLGVFFILFAIVTIILYLIRLIRSLRKF